MAEAVLARSRPWAEREFVLVVRYAMRVGLRL
jgi:hypothetical protein